MNSPIVLCGCGDTIEAETIRIRLASAGIQAFVTGTDTAHALSMGGASTNRLVRVEVAASDLQAASAILEEDELRRLQLGPWTCGRCDERNESSFDVCWNCNKSRTDDDPPAPYEEFAEASSDAIRDSLIQVSSAKMPFEDGNPYRPVLLADEALPSRFPIDLAVEEEVSDNVSRAFYASIIGIILAPPLISLYSVHILWTVDRHAFQVPRLRQRLLFAWGLNLFAIPSWTVFWLLHL